MNLLFVVRLFSGLAEGLREGQWRPQGVPTIYRLIEALDRGPHNVHFVFTVKDKDVNWPYPQTVTQPIEGLRNPITIIAGGTTLPRGLGRAGGYLRELRQAAQIRRLVRTGAPDLIYFDRVNIYQAALTARRTNIPVVWRVMGVPPAMHDMLELADPVARLTRRAYRSPFSMVICSRDGSGGEQWMQQALATDTPRQMMINGVDLDDVDPLPSGIAALFDSPATKVLFVARLVDDKGCLEFVDSIGEALDSEPSGYIAIVAGSGPFEPVMRERARVRGHADRFHFLGQVPHRQILALHRRCDVYVSLNRMCNLTNANLEAMKTGACMVIPASPGVRGIDTDTDALMPDSAVWRISSPDDVAGLAGALRHLRAHPDERQCRAEETARRAAQAVPTWDARIAKEIELLERLAADGS